MEISRLSTGFVWLAFLGTVILGFMHILLGLKLILALLIGFVSAIVHSYSIRYMRGDRIYQRYFTLLFLITVSAYVMVVTDNLWLLVLTWSISNLTLVILMIHKFEWQAAKDAGLLAGINLMFGSLSLLAGAILLAVTYKTNSITQIFGNSIHIDDYHLQFALMFIMLAAFIQSAQWPFHRWLLSSLNSPTPVSALMHAGLINGGGVLLAIFSPLFLKSAGFMMIIFIAGGITALIATYLKLIQVSIKRMLACSTMAQMGFMMMQCGLGFYSAAVVHLCWHGLFKAYLFLSSGSAVKGKENFFNHKPITITSFGLVCLIGALGAWFFALASHKNISMQDSSLVLLGFAFMATSQVAYLFLKDKFDVMNLIVASLSSFLVGLVYGISISILKGVFANSLMDAPQPINAIHLVFLGLFFLGWSVRVLDIKSNGHIKQTGNKFYVWALNASQPESSTLTLNRNKYAA